MADLNIPDLILDPDDDETMLARARSVVSEVSGGKLDPVHPTVDALLQGNVYLVAELLWYLNQLPQALAIENLARLSDTERSAGTYAVGTIRLPKCQPGP
jgi:hypothetical protein